MDKIGKFVYDNPELVYKYKGVVETPSLGMVDDVLCVEMFIGNSKDELHNQFIHRK